MLDAGLKPRSTLEATAKTKADPNGMTDKKCNGKGDSYGKGDGHDNVVAGLDAVFEDALGCQRGHEAGEAAEDHGETD